MHVDDGMGKARPGSHARRPWRAAGLLLALALAGCNALTGANDLVIEDGDDLPRKRKKDPTGAGAGAGDAAGGAGGDLSGGGGFPTHGAGGSSGLTTAATTTSSDAATTTSGGGVVCDYPSGPYGVQQGSTLQGGLAWQGYPENGGGQTATIAIDDFLDCDGSQGVHALLIVSSAEWCGPCQEEAADIGYKAQGWAAKGIRVIELVIEDVYGQPATTATASDWRSSFGLEGINVAADPGFSLAGFGSVGLPLQLVVDPRTMQVVDRQEGFSGSYQALLSLASANAD